jgi:hypothetical protein
VSNIYQRDFVGTHQTKFSRDVFQNRTQLCQSSIGPAWQWISFLSDIYTPIEYYYFAGCPTTREQTLAANLQFVSLVPHTIAAFSIAAHTAHMKEHHISSHVLDFHMQTRP